MAAYLIAEHIITNAAQRAEATKCPKEATGNQSES
jgi:hypothetical protein